MLDRRRRTTIDPELWAKWKLHYRRNDVSQIAELFKVSKPTIYNAILYGAVHQKRLIEGITKFFSDRLARERKAADKLGEYENDQRN